MQGLSFTGGQSEYAQPNQGSSDQLSHLNDLDRNIVQFLQSNPRNSDGVHLAAIGRAIKADPAMVRSVPRLLFVVQQVI